MQSSRTSHGSPTERTRSSAFRSSINTNHGGTSLDRGDWQDSLPSARFQLALSRLRKFAADPRAPITLIGETGTGKSYFARYAHQTSARHAGPLEEVNLATLDDQLASSALFGHVRGAFTGADARRVGAFELAHRGTVFLDEVGKCSSLIQHRLLQVLDSRRFRPLGAASDILLDFRVVVASTRPIGQMVEQGEFLEDLFARIDGFVVTLPPLRERREDIRALAERFLEDVVREVRPGVHPPRMHPELVHLLSRAEWPRNLRELRTVMHRLLLESEGGAELTPELLVDDLQYLRADSRALSSYKLPELQSLLAEHRHDISAAAKALGVHRASVHRHLKRLRIQAQAD